MYADSREKQAPTIIRRFGKDAAHSIVGSVQSRRRTFSEKDLILFVFFITHAHARRVFLYVCCSAKVHVQSNSSSIPFHSVIFMCASRFHTRLSWDMIVSRIASLCYSPINLSRRLFQRLPVVSCFQSFANISRRGDVKTSKSDAQHQGCAVIIGT